MACLIIVSNKITIQIQSETLYIRCNTVLCLAENSANVTEGPGMKTVRTPAEKEHEDLALITKNAGSPPEEVKKNIPPPEKNVNAAKVKQDEKSNPQKRKDSSPPKVLL